MTIIILLLHLMLGIAADEDDAPRMTKTRKSMNMLKVPNGCGVLKKHTRRTTESRSWFTWTIHVAGGMTITGSHLRLHSIGDEI
jgi:hypothetical protein